MTREEIARCEADPALRLKLIKANIPCPRPRARARATPISRRQDKPNAIAWLIRAHPELSDAQVSKLIGTTKPTIEKIRDRSHPDSQNIKPAHPVTLGLCTQVELDTALARAHKTRPPSQRPVDDLEEEQAY